jgi:pimeloyl-ACP methyl ester carboxylesterase
MLLTVVFMTACLNTIDTTDATGLPELIETSMPAVSTTVVETKAPTETVPPATIAETEPIMFDTNITFTYEYIVDGEVMNHLLYTPSTASESEAIPLIVWLHGSGEKYISGTYFVQRGLPQVLNNWVLEGFNAYVLCPQLAGNFGYGSWSVNYSADNLRILLDSFIEKYNVDTNNIIIVGHSLGGQGALYMAHQLSEYFSKCVVLSGYPVSVDISEITIPTIGYVGTARAGEDQTSIDYMVNKFVPVFGESNMFTIATSHANLPNAVFNEDKDNNNRSDVIEWMFEDID